MSAELEAEVARLKAQVARWEDREVERASCCSMNEENAKKLAVALAGTYHAMHFVAGDTKGSMCWCAYTQLIHPPDDPQDAVVLEGDTKHTKECNFARAALGNYLKDQT